MAPKVEAPPLPGTRVPPPGVVAKVSLPRLEAPPPVGTLAPPADVVAKPAGALASKRGADVITGAVLMALGGLVLVSTVRMGIGWGTDGPEGGFVPFWLSIILILCCVFIIVHAIRRGSPEHFATREQLVCVLKVLLPATAMIAATPFIGLYLAGMIYTGVYMRLVGRHSWVLSVVLPLAMTLLVFFVFEKWFLVPLPKGPVEAWLGY
jgi:putative tricarboxylic transport membrane protein